MSTQLILKNRLRSVHNILHITKAMEVVSGVRFRKLMRKIEQFKFYADTLSDIVERLKPSVDRSHTSLFHARKRRHAIVIIVAGDKGLCGPYNENVFKESERFLKTLPTDQLELVLIGNKAIDHFRHRNWKIKAEIHDYARHLESPEVKKWSMEFLNAYENEEIDEAWVVFTHFKSLLSREAKVEKILPLAEDDPHNLPKRVDFISEPEPELIHQSILPHFFYTKLQGILFDSYASELSSRMIAMKAATTNAEEMIEKLTLIKNKNRQLSITREILEITAAAEGLR